MRILAAASTVDWAALGKEVVIALVGGVGVVAAYGVLLLGATGFARARRLGGSPVGSAALVLAGAAVCAAAVAAALVALTTKH